LPSKVSDMAGEKGKPTNENCCGSCYEHQHTAHQLSLQIGRRCFSLALEWSNLHLANQCVSEAHPSFSISSSQTGRDGLMAWRINERVFDKGADFQQIRLSVEVILKGPIPNCCTMANIVQFCVKSEVLYHRSGWPKRRK
jgi:hypothetical protein